ncbi:MAG: HAD-IIIA family hydrolase [Bacilli bacterium]|nr:HAD-IIIA family hydrolase [Bacilli bacterium]
MYAVIQAGGAGTRLKTITGDLPKVMVELNGKPIIEWQIESLKRSGIQDLLIIISKNGKLISDYCGDGKKFGVNISYITEESPLGTAGGLYFAKEIIKDDFILCFGDLMLDVDWMRFHRFHKEKGSSLTAFAHPNSHPFDSDLLVTNDEEKIIKIDSKHNVRDYYYENLTNAGLYVCSKEVLDFIKEPSKIDFEKAVLTHFVEEGKAYAYRSSEYVKDCGTPDRYYSVEKDLKNGIIHGKSLSNLQKCIFLDRDGTINKYRGLVKKADELELADDAALAIKTINTSSYLAICATNQPVIARGDTTFEELRNIHNKMETLLGKDGAYLDALYFCPHHPAGGFEGEVPELKFDCDCRKPKIGLLKKAQERFNIDLSKSWFIGDTDRDIQTGINAGCRTIFLDTTPNPPIRFEDAKPDFVCHSLSEAVNLILTLERGEHD